LVVSWKPITRAAERAASRRIVRLRGRKATKNARNMTAASSGCRRNPSAGTWLKIVHGVSRAPWKAMVF
jgi:hypothetical protein